MISKKEKIEELLNRGVDKIYPSKKGLENLLLKKRIKVYQGFDPSMPNLHLGNLVGILKLRQFQELGHRIIFLAGDFTGMIGDPTDKKATRKKLTRAQVRKNCKSWKSQISKFLDFSGKNPAEIMFNSSWLDKMTFKDLIEITSHFTVQQMIQRDFFQKRLENEKPIFLHEFLYPVAQAIDSVEMNVDLEIGGSDQTFNMLAGRSLMKALNRKEKFVLTTKLLVDKQGKKVGKTTGNAIFLNTPSNDMFGKVMSFPDETIISGFELLTLVPFNQIKILERNLRQKKISPFELKKRLGLELVKMNYTENLAKKAKQEFENVFEKKNLPEKIPTIKINEKILDILELLMKTGLVSSKANAKRLILQRGIKIDNNIQKDWKSRVNIRKGMVIKIGKRKFIKIG